MEHLAYGQNSEVSTCKKEGIFHNYSPSFFVNYKKPHRNLLDYGEKRKESNFDQNR